VDAPHLNPFNKVLSKLEGFKVHGKGHRACCPACGGTSAKMSITETETGAVLLHCFAGCAPADVLAAIDLRLSDLFPTRLREMTVAERREAFNRTLMAQWRAALEVVCTEIAFPCLALRKLAGGEALSQEDEARLQVAEARIDDARNVLCPKPAPFRPDVLS
jgi:hypothetical protein